MAALHRVLLDTDIGTDVDDLMALALLLGTPAVDLAGVTTVYGDTALRARMTTRVAALADTQLAVHAGEGDTLSGREIWWAGHEGTLYPDLDGETFDGADGVGFLIDTVCAAPGEIDVIAIGPLTNIAAAIEREPRFAGAVRHLWIMGGSFGDDEPEHNFRSDAVAARVVFAAGIPTTVTGLEVTRLINLGREALDRIGVAGELGRTIEAEITQWWEFWGTQWNVPHDPVTVLTLTRPELFRFSEQGRVEVSEAPETEGISRFVPGDGRTRLVTGLDADAASEAIVAGIVRAASAAEISE